MKQGLSKTNRRIGVIINYSSLILFLILFYMLKYEGWNILIGSGAAAALIITVISFIRTHVKTRLWRLTHAKIDKLDEREIQVSHESLRHSYGIFSVVCLVIIYISAVTEGGHIHVLIAASLLYLAHTLPASVIAWTEKEV